MWSIGAEREDNSPPQIIAIANQELLQFDLLMKDQALLHYVISLTVSPTTMRQKHIIALQEAGYNDREIHDIVMIVSCFSFMNRLADGTGVTCLDKSRSFAVQLLGEDAWNAHLAWSKGM